MTREYFFINKYLQSNAETVGKGHEFVIEAFCGVCRLFVVQIASTNHI